MTNKTYNALKGIALIWLPALATLYFALAAIWGWPHTTEVIGSLTAVDTALGALLGVSTSVYNVAKPTDGRLVVDKTDPNKDLYQIQLTTPISELGGKNQIVLGVTTTAATSSPAAATVQAPPAS